MGSGDNECLQFTEQHCALSPDTHWTHPGDDTDADQGFYRRIVNIIWKGFIFHDYMKYDTLFPIVII